VAETATELTFYKGHDTKNPGGGKQMREIAVIDGERLICNLVAEAGGGSRE